MKKRSLLLSFLLLGTLASCGGQEVLPPENVPQDPPVEEHKEPTAEEIAAQKLAERKANLKKALAKFNSDFSSTFTIRNSRKFDNPFNSHNNSLVTYTIENTYDHVENSDLVKYKTLGKGQRKNGTPFEIGSEDGFFDEKTGVQYFEYINYKNQVEFRSRLDERNSKPISMTGSIGENVFAHLEESDFEVTVEGPIKVKGTFLENYVESCLQFRGGVESVTATLEGDSLVSFEFKFKDFDNRFTNTNFEGDQFVESLSGKVELKFQDNTISSKSPVPTAKKATLEAVLDKFRASKDNYTVKYGPELTSLSYQVLTEGDKVALDVIDLFSETNPLGTLTWLDARVEKNAEGKYFVNNVVMDEMTGELKWLSNFDIIDQSLNLDKDGNRLPDDKLTPIDLSQINFEKGKFDLDFTSLDTSILTEEADGSFTLTGDSAEYFGECLLSKFPGETGFAIGLGTFLDQFTWTGTTWKIKVIDENSFSFEGRCDLGWQGSSAASTIAGIFCNPGTTSTAPFYVNDIPQLAF